MKVSKVVLIVVALHVMVIGGIFVFEGCSRAKTPGDMTATTSLDETVPAAPVGDPTLAQNLTPTGVPLGSLAPVPAPMPVAPVAPAPVAKTYVVKKGDTLAKIAKIQGASQVELAKANNLTKVSILKIGQKLTVPVKAEVVVPQMAVAPVSAMPVDAAAPVAAVGGMTYAVKSGDSLWKIAKAHNVSVASLKQANNLTSDALKINQKITIPAGQTAQAAQAGITPAAYSEWQPGTHTESGQTVHVVDIGETVAVIAKKYNVAVTELMKANNITDTKRVMAGQRLVIPSASTVSTPAPTPTPTPAMAAPMVSISQ